MEFRGAPYPITKTARGLLYSQSGADLIRSDLLQLLLTNPGERVMLPNYGTPLAELMFDPNDVEIAETARQMIIDAIDTWEPRIAVTDIEVGVATQDDLNPTDPGTDIEHVLSIKILFSDFEDITEIQELNLQVPLGGA